MVSSDGSGPAILVMELCGSLFELRSSRSQVDVGIEVGSGRN